MKRALLVVLVCFLGFAVFLSTPAFAEEQSVAGNTYFGTFTNSCGDIATSCMAFDFQGNIVWDQDLGSGPFVFFGRYEETALGPFSLWSATLDDISPDGQFSLAGLTIFNRFTLMLLRNTDLSCPDQTPLTARGRYRRMQCTPGQRFGATADEYGIGIGGTE